MKTENPQDLTSILYGFSKPLYSTWVYYKPDNLLIDCGEGCATHFGNSGFGIDKILLTHGHSDHISGLPALIWSRASAMGDKTKPLTIYYPGQEPLILALKNYLASVQHNLSFELRWIPVEADVKIPLRANRYIETFQTFHIRRSLSLGYSIKEPRTRLKAEYAGLDGLQLKELLQQNVDIKDSYNGTLITFGGDGAPLDPSMIKGTEILFHEATIIDTRHKRGQTHSTVDDAIRVASIVKPKALVLYHISCRYRWNEIEQAINEAASRYNVTFDVWALCNGNLKRIK